MAEPSGIHERQPPVPTTSGRPFKGLLKHGEPLLSAMVVEYPRPSTTKIFCNAGFDFVFIEKEHGMFYGSELPDFGPLARESRMLAISKVDNLNCLDVDRLFEDSVAGIQLPRTKSAEQVAKIVGLEDGPLRESPRLHRFCRYLSGERRGIAGARQQRHGGDRPPRDDEETGARGRERLHHLRDMVCAGPYDTSISLSHPGGSTTIPLPCSRRSTP